MYMRYITIVIDISINIKDVIKAIPFWFERGFIVKFLLSSA